MPTQIFIRPAIALASLVCMACAHGAAIAEAATAPADALATVGGQACQPGENMVFKGDVQDDFGLGIAVCLEGETLSVRYSGEGDPQVVSCQVGQCGGVIDFTHYVRYRFTVLTLTWRDQYGEQALVESFDAQSARGEPAHTVSHTWRVPSLLWALNWKWMIGLEFLNGLTCADLAQESLDLLAERICLLVELLGAGEHLSGRCPGGE